MRCLALVDFWWRACGPMDHGCPLLRSSPWVIANIRGGARFLADKETHNPKSFSSSSRLWPSKTQTGWTSVPHHTSFQKFGGLFYLWTSVWILVVSLQALPQIQCLGKSFSQKDSLCWAKPADKQCHPWRNGLRRFSARAKQASRIRCETHRRKQANANHL